MPYKTPAIVFGFAACAAVAAPAFAQEKQIPSMPADLARMAESARTAMAQSAAQNAPAPSMPADLARMAESARAAMGGIGAITRTRNCKFTCRQIARTASVHSFRGTQAANELARVDFCRRPIHTQRIERRSRRLP
jgi:hypothetical protein